MAKMNKEQRSLVSKMICEAAVKALTKKHFKSLKTFNCTIELKRAWGDNPIHDIVLDLPIRCKLSTALGEQLTKNKEYIVTCDKNGTPHIAFNAKAEKELEKQKAPLIAIRADINKFNTTMATKYILTTSFTSVDDVHEFIKEFSKNLFK